MPSTAEVYVNGHRSPSSCGLSYMVRETKREKTIKYLSCSVNPKKTIYSTVNRIVHIHKRTITIVI